MHQPTPFKFRAALLALFALFIVPVFASDPVQVPAPEFDTGNTAFMFGCSVLVLLMTLPGLALDADPRFPFSNMFGLPLLTKR